MKAVGYIRVSTENQTQGVSLDNQKAKIKAYADLKDLQLIGKLGKTWGKTWGRP